MIFSPFLLAASLAAGAPMSHDTVQAEVTFADLDIATEAGRAQLDSRVRGAIKRMCGHPGSRTMAERQATQKCQMTARRDAEDKVAFAVARSQMNRQLAIADKPSAPTR